MGLNLSDSIAVKPRVIFSGFNSMPWIVCLSAGLFFFYAFLQLNIFDVINEPLRQDFGINAAELSLMSSTFLWADILFLIPAGMILDRFSTRKVVLYAMIACIAGTLGFAVTDSYITASFYRGIIGASNAFCFLTCVILVSRWFEPRRQALVMGLLVTMAFIGGMVAHTPLAYLNEHFGWRNALIIDAAFGAFLFIWLFFGIKDRPKKSVLLVDHVDVPKANFFQVLKNKQNWLTGFYTAFMNLPILVICSLWGGSYLQIVHGLPILTSSNIVSLILLGSIFGCPLAGWMSDRWGKRKPVMIIGSILTFIFILPLYMNVNITVTVLSVIFFCWGLFTSTQVVIYPMITESNDLSNTGLANSIASIIIMGGGALAQMVFGHMVHHHASSASYQAPDLEFAMWMFPITTIFALVAILFTRETYCKRSH